MKIVMQRVKGASVSVEGKEIASIGKGALLLAGIGKDDDPRSVLNMALKISKMRIFEDENGRMNLDLKQVKGKVLSVPQFTLFADTKKGNRPGFDDAAEPGVAETLWKKFNEFLRQEDIAVEEGAFGLHMDVKLINDGPVTFVLDQSKEG